MTGLEEYIVDDPLNKSNLDSLISSFKTETFVPFIGAGPSTVLGAKDWEGLITNLCKLSGPLKFKKTKNLDGKIDYPSSFSRLFKKLNTRGVTAEQFYNELFEYIRPTLTEWTCFHLNLVTLFDSCITTNYDSPIERAFEKHHHKPATRYFFSCYGLNNLRDCIVYLHGHKEINFCIIKSEDYDYFYPTVSKKNGIPILEKFLTDILRKRMLSL